MSNALRHRELWLAGLLVVLLVVGAYVTRQVVVRPSTVWPPEVPAPYNQVREGMTIEEVLQLVGGNSAEVHHMENPPDFWDYYRWSMEGHRFEVVAVDGRVHSARWVPVGPHAGGQSVVDMPTSSGPAKYE